MTMRFYVVETQWASGLHNHQQKAFSNKKAARKHARDWMKLGDKDQGGDPTMWHGGPAYIQVLNIRPTRAGILAALDYVPDVG